MATPDLTTWDGQIEAIQNWLVRADLAEMAPAFIQVAEAQLNRELRVRDMLTRVHCPSDVNFPEFISLPNDFLETYTLVINPDGLGPESALEYVNQRDAQSLKANRISGPVRYYSIVDNVFELLPTPTTALDLKLTYYARIPALTAAAPRNWLSIKSPDLYLFAALAEAAPYMNDDSRTQVWITRRAKLVEDMHVESERSMRPRTQLVSRAKPLDGISGFR